MFNEELMFRDCPWCGVTNAHFQVLAQEVEALLPAGVISSAGYPQRWWTVLSCPRCAKVVAIETNHPGGSPGRVFDVVPDTASSVDVEHLPEDVERHYKSAQRVLAAGEPDLAAVSLRRTIEAAAHHKGIEERVLVKSVQRMVDDGLITADFHSVIDHIRRVGNVGAHAGSPELGQREVARALRFTTQALRNLFEIPAILAEIGDEARADADPDETPQDEPHG